MIKRILSAVVCVAAVLTVCSCAYSPPKTNPEKLNIVATNFPAYDFCRQIAGEKAEITMLLSPGEESHSYDPTPMDILKVNTADLFVYGGGESDEWAKSILHSAERDIPRVTMMEYTGLYEEEAVSGTAHRHEHTDEDEAEYDEHVWTSPVNADLICRAITEALCELDEANADYYRKRYTLYSERLDVLHEAFRGITESREHRQLVFADRFPLLYFVKEYGLDYSAAFPGCSGETEASPKTISRLIKNINDNNIPYILKLELSNDSMAKSVAGQTGAEILTFYSCQTVSKNDFENGETYLSLMQKNLDTLYRALDY